MFAEFVILELAPLMLSMPFDASSWRLSVKSVSFAALDAPAAKVFPPILLASAPRCLGLPPIWSRTPPVPPTVWVVLSETGQGCFLPPGPASRVRSLETSSCMPSERSVFFRALEGWAVSDTGSGGELVE